MKLSKFTALVNWFLVGVLIVCVAVSIEDARAGGDDLTNIAKNNNTATGGANDLSLGGNDALGLGFSYALGDVDLNEGQNCYVSTAKGNIIFGRQKVELNAWCASLFYDANGKHEFAAKMRCSIDTINAEYDTKDECVAGQTFHVRPPENENDFHTEQMNISQQLQSKVEALEAALEARERPQVRRVVEQHQFIDEAKRAKLLALRNEDE